MVLTTELLGIRNALAESREKKLKKDAAKGKFHYPNPKFWRCRDNMDFKAQGRNLMEIGKICVEMFKEADKKGFCMKQVERCRNDLARCALEFNSGISTPCSLLKRCIIALMKLRIRTGSPSAGISCASALSSVIL